MTRPSPALRPSAGRLAPRAAARAAAGAAAGAAARTLLPCLLALAPACASTADDARPESPPAAAPAAPIAPGAPRAPAPVAAPAPTIEAARLLVASSRFAEAVPMLQAIVEREPDNAEAWFNLGYSLHALGRLGEALPVHERAARFPAVRPVALYNLGCAHALLGDREAAFEALGRAVDAGFKDVDVMRTDGDLASLRGDARWEPLVARAEGREEV